MRRLTRVFLITGLVMIFLPGCGSRPGAKAWRGGLETADGITVVSNPRAPMHDLGASVRPQVSKGGKMYGLEDDGEGSQMVKRCRLV
jgi:hypothetical protein